jgi:uncharacterized protein YyaL (SSP411 family)
MEHESFENEEIARQMNENFINIKVDREERPDLDHIYMNAVQLMTGHGGWPMTVFLTPDLVPFYGGTYYPPEDRYNMPGFPRVLAAVARAFRDNPAEVAQQSQALLAELRRLNLTRASPELLTTALLDVAAAGIARNYDSTYGGFGGAPKFPPSMTLEFLLRMYHRTGRKHLLEIVTHTCRRMAEGGLYDQLGGGFHRYSTDARWLVPHFEKMLYDNAQLAPLYLHVYQATHDEFFRRIAEETLDYVRREMTDEGGGFYSTQDADSEGVEGKFFVWSAAEIDALLGADDGPLLRAYYGATEAGNFEGANILHVTGSVDQIARERGISSERLQEVIQRGRQKLFAARQRRIRPGRDEKVLTSWNGLMLAAFAEAAAVLDRPDYLETARANAQFLLGNLRRDRALLHSYKDGVAKLNGYLDDYSFVAAGLVTLYEASGEILWLAEARAIVEWMIEEFWDDEDGGFFYTGRSHEELIVRAKDFYDSATPSGNSVAADVLLRLAVLLDNADYRRRATSIFRLLRDSIARYPAAFGRALCALDFHLSTPKEIAIIRAGDRAPELAREIWTRYLPNKIVAPADQSDAEAAQLVPLLRGREAIGGRTTVYVCENYVCRQPVTSVAELAAQLDEANARQT